MWIKKKKISRQITIENESTKKKKKISGNADSNLTQDLNAGFEG